MNENVNIPASRIGAAMTHEELRNWARMRHHFDATRDQQAVGAAVIALLDDREDWMRRAAVAVDRAEKAEERLDVLRVASDEYRLWRPGEKGHADAHRALFDALDAALAADDAARGDE